MADTTRLAQNALRQLPWLWQFLGKSWRPYALALSLVAATIAASVFFGPQFHEPYLFLIPSILIAGTRGGMGRRIARDGLGPRAPSLLRGGVFDRHRPAIGRLCS